jgi:hypothetical protein
MKLRNWLPTKYLTEENPVIGLSFEVGYARLHVGWLTVSQIPFLS